MHQKAQSPSSLFGAIEANPSVPESRYEIVKRPSIPGRKKKKGVTPAVDIFHEKTIPSLSKITLKPLKPVRSAAVDTDEMARLYDKYLETNNETIPDEEVVAAVPNRASTNMPSKVSRFFKSTKRLGKKKDCLNANILTEDKGTKIEPTAAKWSLRFLKQKSQAKYVHTVPLEKIESSSSDPTVVSHDSNSIIDTFPAPDDVSTRDDTAMDISVFEVFEQYTNGAFPHHCSPRLPPKNFEINKQAELLSQIEKLQKELSDSKGAVQELSLELEEVYSGKDAAINKLDRLIESSKLNGPKDDEHEKLREIRMYLTDRTEPTISSITTAGSYRTEPYDYHPFCSCMRSGD